LCYGCI